MSDYDNKICYICGKEDADTDDHVPPKNIFLKKYRNIGDDLITIPAHQNCNKRFEKDDEYFRFCLSIPSYWDSEKAREMWDVKMKDQLHRPESQGFRSYLLKNIKPIDLYTEAGIYLGKGDVAMLDAKRMEAVLERTARGIFYKTTRNILPIDWPIEIQMLHPVDGRKQMVRFSIESKLSSIGNGIFKFFWQPTKEDQRIGLFWLIFFDSVYFWVFSGLPEKGNST
jgi:hypothetical protein